MTFDECNEALEKLLGHHVRVCLYSGSSSMSIDGELKRSVGDQRLFSVVVVSVMKGAASFLFGPQHVLKIVPIDKRDERWDPEVRITLI